MHLKDLNPKWVSLVGWASDRPFYIGVSFDCPCELCRKEPCPCCGHKERVQRLTVKFWWPIDPSDVAGSFAAKFERHHLEATGSGAVFDRVRGESFDDLTILQPINVVGHWHGRLQDGELLTGYE